MKPCKICNTKTNLAFNINFKAIPICELCAATIFLQQAQWYVGLPVNVIMKEMKKDADRILKMKKARLKAEANIPDDILFKPHTLNQQYESKE